MESSTNEDNDKKNENDDNDNNTRNEKRVGYEYVSRKWVENVESGLTFTYKITVSDSGL